MVSHGPLASRAVWDRMIAQFVLLLPGRLSFNNNNIVDLGLVVVASKSRVDSISAVLQCPEAEFMLPNPATGVPVVDYVDGHPVVSGHADNITVRYKLRARPLLLQSSCPGLGSSAAKAIASTG